MKFNRIPACGGELGECSGNEPKGVKTTRKSCRRLNAVLPFAFDYDEGTRQHDRTTGLTLEMTRVQ